MTEQAKPPQATPPAKPPTAEQSPAEREKTLKEVAELEKKLAEAKAKLGQTGGFRETTGEEDLKMLAERSQSSVITVVGRPGGPFTISGSGFGQGQSSGAPPWPGQVMIGGRTVPITSWRDHSIKGSLPADLPEKGDVEVTINAGAPMKTGGTTTEAKTLKGKWPPEPAVTVVAGQPVASPPQVAQKVAAVWLPGAQGEQGGGPDMNPPPGSTGTYVGQQVGSGSAAPPVAPAGPSPAPVPAAETHKKA
jgi:hypothetical protein